MEHSKKSANRNSTYDIYIGHVPKDLPKGSIEDFFSNYGPISDILYRFGNGSYGYVIVKFKNQKDANKVLNQMGTITINGHEMEVKKGKITNQSSQNGNETNPMPKTVTFAEPCISIRENPGFVEPFLYDNNFTAHPQNGNEEFSVMVEVICTHVENAVTFFGCYVERCTDLQCLAKKLNSICPNSQPLLRKPALKKVYGALFHEDNSWYRCSVIQCTVPSKPGFCIVQYLDYGNIAEVNCADMVELPEPLRTWTPFAVKCVLSNLLCNPKYYGTVTYLNHLVHQRMSLCAVAQGHLEYQVLKCTCNGIDVVSELIRNGFAIHKSQLPTNFLPSPTNTVSLKSPGNQKSKKKSNKKTAAANNANKVLQVMCNDDKKAEAKCNGQKSRAGCNGTAVGNACNGILKYPSEVNNNNEEVQEIPLMNSKPSSSDEFKCMQDFVPKTIIKRRSVITEPVSPPTLEGSKTVNRLLKVDCVITNLKLVNNIRSLFPLQTDDDLINSAINLLQNEVDVTESKEPKEAIEKSYQKYHDSLTELKKCSDQELLMDLKIRRDEARLELLNDLKQFIESFDSSLPYKKKKIQETIIALESNSNAWMNVYLSKPADTLDDLLMVYNQEKEKKKNNIQKARQNTNEKHNSFQKFLGELQKEFSLNMEDGISDKSELICAGGKRGSWTLKFEESLSELDTALEEESSTSTMAKNPQQVSVVEFILKKLDIPKEKIDAECELFEKYKALYDELNDASDLSPVLDELYTLQKSIQAISTNYVDNEDDPTANNVLVELHNAMLQEGVLLENIAKASLHFPELVLEHPELKLYEYQRNSYLVKYSWDGRFFPSFQKCNRLEPSYISKLADEPVVIKEFKIGKEMESKAFVKKAVAWNEIKSKSLVKVKALFACKDESVFYAVLPPVWETLYDKPPCVPVDYGKALNLLQQVLAGLCDIHSRGIAHGAVHPLAILHNDNEVLLDFNFDRNCLQDKFCLKGINFQVPCVDDLYKSADMYGFGCLVLWVLFHNLSFTSTDQGIPNLCAFQSIIQDLLTVRDFASLSALLNVNQDLRPSSRMLLSNGFLKNLRIVSGTKK